MTAPIRLEDRYATSDGTVFLSGMQALVLLTLLQGRRDREAGLDTAGFVSGYRGSPLSAVDVEFERARAVLDRHNIRFHHGINEALAATAVWGTQNTALDPRANCDGVYAMWYGKGAGLDQCVDVMRHANNAGTAPRGGVLAVSGDDHALKSSAQAHHCEPTFADLHIPVLYPCDIGELLEFGLLGWALSRHSGCWVGLKTVPEVVNSTATVVLSPGLGRWAGPARDGASADRHVRWPDPWPAGERRFHAHKLPVLLDFARSSGVNRMIIESASPQLLIVTTGKSFLDVLEALRLLGLHAASAADQGLSIYKVGMPWPLAPDLLLDSSRRAGTVLVVEEKRPVIEEQLKVAFYDRFPGGGPRILGRQDEDGQPLFHSVGELSPLEIARAISQRLPGLPGRDRVRQLETISLGAMPDETRTNRTPFFCSGCPHSTSTVVPEGSRAMAGIGCHGMAMLTPHRNTTTHTHMGGEGATWIGQAPFTRTPHVFQNLGEGTYFHSGSLAIRAAVAAGVNITYKLLYNDAVAMTGGQPLDGELGIAALTRQLQAEGVRRICLVTDAPRNYRGDTGLAPGTQVHGRDELDRVQRELREIPGVTVLIYEQVCATENRRRRKRGLAAQRDERVFINDLVCEGCGDCGVQSNCLSVVPVETEFGRKRAIDQSACNQDYSCLKGFCPSFVTITGGRRRRGVAGRAQETGAPLPDPILPPLPADKPWDVLITGVGGTGVVTIAAVIGMAAHLEGSACSIHDRLGMAQKFGPVTSHVRISRAAGYLAAQRIPVGSADTLISGDPITFGNDDVLQVLAPGATRIVFNSDCSNVGSFVHAPDLDFGVDRVQQRLQSAAGEGRMNSIAATQWATAVCGDTIGTNMLLLGYAWQQGCLPLALASLDRAIELNGTAVEQNRLLFHWGRRLAAFPEESMAILRPYLPWNGDGARSTDLEAVIDGRRRFLIDYQDENYAARYLQRIERVRRMEAQHFPGSSALTLAAARGYFRALAIKDEYEVARLHTAPAFRDRIASQFEGDFRLSFHLAPPLLARRDPRTGHPAKIRFGSWLHAPLRLLASLRRVRGGPLDPFRFSRDRRLDRRLLADYEALVDTVIAGGPGADAALVEELLASPEQVRGFGHVKERNAVKSAARVQDLLRELTAARA